MIMPVSGPFVIDSPVLVLIGPTAIGKTSLSLAMATQFGCEIVSMDSMQVYRHMDIGTAKPSPRERAAVRHHLIDITDPDEQYDAARFVADAQRAMRQIAAAGKIPLLTGGTGLYLKALTQGLFSVDRTGDSASIRDRLLERLRKEGRGALFRELTEKDPATAARLHPNDSQRLLRALEILQATGVSWSAHLMQQGEPPVRMPRLRQIGLNCERQVLYRRIEERSELMLAQGLLAEVANLRQMGYSTQLPSMQAIGYRHANQYLDGVYDHAEMRRLLVRDTRRYAKRQLTWFRAMPAIHWYDRDAADEIVAATERWLREVARL
jgi:tRNA dimethylallyltransferase